MNARTDYKIQKNLFDKVLEIKGEFTKRPDRSTKQEHCYT